MQDNRLPNLTDLEDWELENSDQDVRGQPLLTRSGESVGVVRRMLVDREHERVAALVLDNGRTVPVEEVEIRDGHVYIDELREMPQGFTAPETRGAVEEAIPVVEEELAVGKRTVERGRIQVRSRVIERPVEESVRLREEHVDVERRRVDQPISGDDASALFQERTVEMRETAEEAVVAKEARVVEEVVVRKDVDEHVEHVHDTVRRTDVDVERIDETDRRR